MHIYTHSNIQNNHRSVQPVCGVGITPAISDRGVHVASLADGLSAKQSGAVEIGDEILKIDDTMMIDGCSLERIRSVAVEHVCVFGRVCCILCFYMRLCLRFGAHR